MLVRQMLPIQLIQNYLKQRILTKNILKTFLNTFYIIKIIDLTKNMPIKNSDILPQIISIKILPISPMKNFSKNG
jgi:hypothetical protein